MHNIYVCRTRAQSWNPPNTVFTLQGLHNSLQAMTWKESDPFNEKEKLNDEWVETKVRNDLLPAALNLGLASSHAYLVPHLPATMHPFPPSSCESSEFTTLHKTL